MPLPRSGAGSVGAALLELAGGLDGRALHGAGDVRAQRVPSPQAGVTTTSRSRADGIPTRRHGVDEVVGELLRAQAGCRRWARGPRAAGGRPRRRPRCPPTRGGAAARCRARGRWARRRAAAARAARRRSSAAPCRRRGRRARSRARRPPPAGRGSGSRPQPDEVGSRPASTVGSDGSSTCSTTSAPGTRERTAATCRRTPSASDSTRSRQAPSSTMTRSPRCSQRLGGEGPRPDDLQLERPGVAVEGLGELVEVLAQQRGRALGVAAGSVDEAPPDGLEVDRQLDEQPGGAADHVGARAALGQLGQVGQLRRRAARAPARSASRTEVPGQEPIPVASVTAPVCRRAGLAAAQRPCRSGRGRCGWVGCCEARLRRARRPAWRCRPWPRGSWSPRSRFHPGQLAWNRYSPPGRPRAPRRRRGHLALGGRRRDGAASAGPRPPTGWSCRSTRRTPRSPRSSSSGSRR